MTDIISPMDKETDDYKREVAAINVLKGTLKADKILIFYERNDNLHSWAEGFCDNELLQIGQLVTENAEEGLEDDPHKDT